MADLELEPGSVTWVYSEAEKAWYMAMCGVRDSYTDHLKQMGYNVAIQLQKPEEAKL